MYHRKMGARLAFVVAMTATGATAAEPRELPARTEVRQLARCRVQLVVADRETVRNAARERFVVPVDVAVTPLGDRVESLHSTHLPPPATPPRTDTEARVLARQFLDAHADLFGIGFELPNVDLVGFRQDRGWLFRAPVRRTVVVAQSYEVTAEVAIVLDRDGRVRDASVAGLLPQFAICTGPILKKGDPRLVAHVVGSTLPFGAVAPADVKAIEAGVIAISDFTYAVGYKIVVERDGHHWRFAVDGDTGDVIAVEDLL
jgi:hypothetical protein